MSLLAGSIPFVVCLYKYWSVFRKNHCTCMHNLDFRNFANYNFHPMEIRGEENAFNVIADAVIVFNRHLQVKLTSQLFTQSLKLLNLLDGLQQF